MTTPPPDKPADFTASDILSADAWTGRAPKPVVGVDVVCTKIAVDFQNMRRETVEECVRRNLELLRGATGADCAFLATLNPEDGTIAEVQLARSAFAQCRPEGLSGLPLDGFPWLKGRLEHLRLSELRDTQRPAQGAGGRSGALRGAAHRLGAASSRCARRASRPVSSGWRTPCRAAPGT